MARAIGLECEAISGWSKDLDVISSSQSGDHAWNAVKVNGKWRLLDVTWAAGHRGPSGFEKQFSGWFFFPKPEYFVQSHLPSNPRWQFVDPPWSKQRFDSLPHTWAAFFELGLALGSHLDKTIPVTNGQFKFWLHVPSDVYVGENFYQGSTRLSIQPQADGKIPGTSRYEILFDLRGQNPDRFVVYASRSINGARPSVLEYSVRMLP